MDSTRAGQINRERSLAWARATDAADRNALHRARVAVIERGVREAVFTAPDLFPKLNFRAVAERVVEMIEG
jgi:hypothetical protein